MNYGRSDGGKKERCGWLRDRYGVSWQIIPTALGKLLSDPDPAKSKRVIRRCFKWRRLTLRV
jgi:predicted 3-demethylubiquinone-9 3-methyltransferase (glyoxalase superfamily)